MKIVSFSLSRDVTESSNSDKSRIVSLPGLPCYIDPKLLSNINYQLNKKSDVYSIGVLLWQISSGYCPFNDKRGSLVLSMGIVQGLREQIIMGTPVEYSDLYTRK